MSKTSFFSRILVIFSLLTLVFWWTFFVVWQPATIDIISLTTHKFSKSSLSPEVINTATRRAVTLVKKGASFDQDIFFGSDELEHLWDVATIYQTLRIFLAGGAVFSWTILLLHLAKRLMIDRQVWSISRNFLLVLISFLGVTGSIFFPLFFTIFHLVLFPNGNWSFASGSMLVEIFPEIFWKLELGFIIFILGIFAGIFHLALRQKHHGEN